MRVLVEQTRECVVEWLSNLGLLAVDAPAEHSSDQVAVHVLMGGDLEIDWDHWPERDQILIGTQDMLLSRALNRGYAMSRYRWPVQFGLLNNDCLWVLDEVQLMGSGLATSAQLQAFRRKLGTIAGTPSIWMSATMLPEWLETIDFQQALDAPYSLEISSEDHLVARPRLEAIKKLERADFDASTNGRSEAELARQNHTAGTRTMVVVNTVKRAQAIYKSLCKAKTPAEVVLLHSQFRQVERNRALERVLADPEEQGTIAVCTQVVEAGVDVSAKLLISDLAPWSSMVQRFGRCNRAGEYNDNMDAMVVWIAPPNLDNDRKLKSAPYTGDSLRAAAERLGKLTDVGPSRLPPLEESLTSAHVLRRKDLVELFDTTPDLAGADIDVSRFIREVDEHHVQVFWREVTQKAPPASDELGPAREELCSVPLGEINLGKRKAWRWDHLEKQWSQPAALYPGLVLMLAASEGGYDKKSGWMANHKKQVPVLSTWSPDNDHNDRDSWSEHRSWEAIATHTGEVANELERLVAAMGLASSPLIGDLRIAALWHDAGKAHEVFQGALPDEKPPGGPWAKSEGKMKYYERPGFRHELASALAMLGHELPDLAAYLAAAHHGKVRLSIRSLPHETRPEDDTRRFARGVWDGDVLPEFDLENGVTIPTSRLDLSYMELGEDPRSGPSWLARMLALRDAPDLGPFRLAFLEALIRIADWRASGAAVTEQPEEVS